MLSMLRLEFALVSGISLERIAWKFLGSDSISVFCLWSRGGGHSLDTETSGMMGGLFGVSIRKVLKH